MERIKIYIDGKWKEFPVNPDEIVVYDDKRHKYNFKMVLRWNNVIILDEEGNFNDKVWAELILHAGKIIKVWFPEYANLRYIFIGSTQKEKIIGKVFGRSFVSIKHNSRNTKAVDIEWSIYLMHDTSALKWGL